MQRVFVLGNNKKPLMPCHPARARQMLKAGKAAVYCIKPFTIILKQREDGDTQVIELKFDPGSKTTGMAILLVGKKGRQVIWAAHLHHRGQAIRDALLARRAIRRSRRQRQCRYRAPRFLNRTRKPNWLPPSLQSRVDNIVAWCSKLIKFTPISHLLTEVVRFDTQKLRNPEIDGVHYQRGKKEKLIAINKQLMTPLKDAASVNATRYAIYSHLKKFGLSVEQASGGLTKYNRSQQGFEKSHWIDAACVGESGRHVSIPASLKPLEIKATGRGTRQVCRVNAYGFPRTSPKTNKLVQGFKTGDLVRALVTKGKKIGKYVGKVAVRASGYFNIVTHKGTIQGLHVRYCRLIQRMDGYSYG